MKKITKMIIFLTGAALLTGGVKYTLDKRGSSAFKEYIEDYTSDIDDDDFFIAAHRGFSSLEVENTLDAIKLAASKGYIDIIEVDARLTKDGKLVLSHDNILFNGLSVQNISHLNYDKATKTFFTYPSFGVSINSVKDPEKSFIIERQSNLQGRKYNIVGLCEGLNACGDKIILLDLKYNYNSDITLLNDELMRELEGVDTSNIIFQSLNIDGIRDLKNRSNYNCLALVDSKADIDNVSDFDMVGIKYTLVNEELIDKLINEGKKVAIWTINNTKELERTLDNIGDHYEEVIYISDYPDLIVTRLHEKQKVKKKGNI
jgi:glycerophosphoryl diester phosphodiesterase